MYDRLMFIFHNCYEKCYERDKQQHFAISFVIFIMLYPLMYLGWVFAVTLLIGLIKELWDHYAGSGFCWWDMIANILGIAAAMACIVWVSI